MSFFSQKGLIVILNIKVGHFADQVVNWFANFFVLKPEKSLIYEQNKFNLDQLGS